MTFIYLGRALNALENEILNLSEKEKKHHQLTLLNTFCCICSSAIAERLDMYLDVVHVAPEDKKHIKMKNEFYNETLIVTYAMKSYIALQLRQEGDVFKHPKLDVKGVNFFKSTSSKATTDFIYKDVLMDQLLQPKDGQIKLDRVHDTIYRYQKEMETRIAQGDMGYLKRSIRVKSADGYSKPMSIGQYKATWVWNQICEDKDTIALPSTVTLVKVKIQKPSDLAPLAPEYPEIYERLLNLFETEITIGGGKITVKNDNGEKVEKTIPMSGIKAIALPNEYDEVPDWMLKVIDVETLVNDNLKLFTQLQKPLGFTPGSATHNGSTLTYYSNIVRI